MQSAKKTADITIKSQEHIINCSLEKIKKRIKEASESGRLCTHVNFEPPLNNVVKEVLTKRLNDAGYDVSWSYNTIGVYWPL